MKRLLITILSIIAATTVFAQSYPQNPNCPGLKNPTNFTFTGTAKWTGYTGTKPDNPYVSSTCSTSGSSFTTTVQAANLESQLGSSYACYGTSSTDIHGQIDYQRRFVIKGSGSDILTNNNVSYLPPDTSFHTSIRLGSPCGDGEAEMLTYEFNVTSENCLVTIWYAMSLYNALHTAPENPEFVIVVEKQQGTNWVLAGGDTLCYIRASPTSNNNLGPFSQTGSNVYLNWNKVIVNLSKLQYQKVRIKISTCDCCYTAHYGYCYFAGECQPMKLNANGCAAGESTSVARIAAPKGAISYTWYRSKTGELAESDQLDDTKYIQISGQTDSVLYANIDQFIHNTTGDTLTKNTFMCKMTTKMNEIYPITSKIAVNVGNTKPTIIVDSAHNCNAEIFLQDLSVTPYTPRDSDMVDTSHTRWYFYSTAYPTPQSLVDSVIGGTAVHRFNNGGTYSVRIRTSAYDTTCWNEKTFTINTIKPPVPQIALQRDSLCEGDTIAVFNRTTGARYNDWTIVGRDTLHYLAPTIATRFRFDTTSTIYLHTRDAKFYLEDTNSDGVLDEVYCYVDTSIVVHVDEYPILSVTGDSIVCNGTESLVNVSSQNEQTTYDWFTSTASTNPLQSNTATLSTMPTHDMRYYVRATSPYGCISWDSINIYIVDPKLEVPITSICDNETVKLFASNAYRYTWTSMPNDPSMVGQEHNDTLVVRPHSTTTYTLTGHGMNNCSATPLTQTIKVYPFPVPTVEMNPKFIDSEVPEVTFRDVSPGATTSLWDFGNGNTSTERQLRHTFTDLSEDSVLISLTTGNELNCTSDTMFYVPIVLFSVWFPNAFTPTESTNRTFKCFTHNELEFYTLYIYDRRGVQVFYSTDQNAEWDGTHNGKVCPTGVYVYTCTYRRPGTSDIVTRRGTVTLLQ